MPNGNLTSDSQEKANILNKCFVSVFEIEGNENLLESQDRPFIAPLCSVEISNSKLSKAIDKVKAIRSEAQITSTLC